MKITRSKAKVISELTIDADIPMATYKLTGLGAGAGAGQSVRYEQVIGVFLPLAGGAMTGDISFSALKGIKTAFLYLKDTGAAVLNVRNLADSAYADVNAKDVNFTSLVGIVATSYIKTRNADANVLNIQSRNTGSALNTIARLVGAADPYFEATLPMVLNPSAIPGTLVNGHFWLDSTSHKLNYRANGATLLVASEAKVTSDIADEATARDAAIAAHSAVKVKLETRAMDAASGDVAYTGYGFLPTGLIIHAFGPITELSIGSSEPALTEHCLYKKVTAATIGTGPQIIYLEQGSSLEQKAVVKTYDADGFTLTWTRVGATEAGTASLHVFAFK